MIFIEFIEKIYPYCGNGRNKASFIHDFLIEIVDEYNKEIDKDETECGKYLNFKRKLPKKACSYLLSHIDVNNFIDFIINNSNDTSLNELCYEFREELPNATKNNIAEKLVAIFIQVIKESLKNKKTTILNNQNGLELEKAISEIIIKFSNTPKEKYDSLLKYEPYNIDKKIEEHNWVLKNDIRNNVINYYSYIEELFKDLSTTDSTIFDRLAKEIKYRSDNLINEGNSQEVVFNTLVDWLKNKVCTKQDTACRAIISFFVQDCEVFHEIS